MCAPENPQAGLHVKESMAFDCPSRHLTTSSLFGEYIAGLGSRSLADFFPANALILRAAASDKARVDLLRQHPPTSPSSHVYLPSFSLYFYHAHRADTIPLVPVSYLCGTRLTEGQAVWDSCGTQQVIAPLSPLMFPTDA
jgi:hypothetical protein